MRPVEAPTVTQRPGPGNALEEVTTHPAFAQIGASRVSGHANLYDSDFQHNAYMVIRISRSELHRNLSNDWHFGREQIVEVALSEAQWATFVSAPNVGSGVPCTLAYLQGVEVPGLPAPASRTDQFGREAKDTLRDALARIDAAIAAIDTMGLPKGKAATLRDHFAMARQELVSNIPFVAGQFGEHMEKTVEKAKAEVHGYMTGALMRSGLAALGGHAPLQIEDQSEEARP